MASSPPLASLRILKKVNFIAAEDTRKTRRLLTYHNINGRFISYHEHNETERTEKLIGKLKQGSSIALVTNAGTPVVSDPGYPLIKAAIGNEIPVIPIPGVSAAITALSAAGLPTDSFVFIGFVARKPKKRLPAVKDITCGCSGMQLSPPPSGMILKTHCVLLPAHWAAPRYIRVRAKALSPLYHPQPHL